MNEIELQAQESPRVLASKVEQGLSVEIDGYFYSRLRVPADAGLQVCDFCNVGSNCKGRVLETCCELLPQNGYKLGLWKII